MQCMVLLRSSENAGNLCRMRSLETAAQAGVLIVAALATIILVSTVQAGFPAVHSGELPLWGLKVSLHPACSSV